SGRAIAFVWSGSVYMSVTYRIVVLGPYGAAKLIGGTSDRLRPMLLRRVAGVIVVLAFAFPAAASAHHRAPRWVPVPTGSTQQHRGLDAVDKRTVWVSGTCGEVLRTTD